MDKEIIDWEDKGNLVRFYFGKNGSQHGDDWNDSPWDCNAGAVYTEFVEGCIDICFPFDTTLFFAKGENLYLCKNDFVKRKYPFLFIPFVDESRFYSFQDAMEDKFTGGTQVFFGDNIESLYAPFILYKSKIYKLS